MEVQEMQKNEETGQILNPENHKNESQDIQVILFKLHTEKFAMDINKIRYIVKYPDITNVPNAKPYIHGVMNLRGKIITVVNLNKKVGLPSEDKTKHTRIIITEIGGDWVGFLVDFVSEVIKINSRDILPTPATIGSGVSHEYIKGVSPLESDLLILFDIDKLFKPQELGINPDDI
jgi:purine-binding chemotaxis protein CheW